MDWRALTHRLGDVRPGMLTRAGAAMGCVDARITTTNCCVAA